MSTTQVNEMKHISTFALDDGISVVIEPRVWEGKQSYECEAVFRLGIGCTRAWNGALHGGHSEQVKVRVVSDFYDFQSSARATIWDPRERRWNPLVEIPYPQMRTKRPLPGDLSFQTFREDVQALLADARAVLGTYLPAHADAWKGGTPRFLPVL